MQILALDDEPLLLETLIRSIKIAEPNATVHGFTHPSVALKFIIDSKVSPEIIFLDIEMPEMTGLEFVTKVKQINPKINIIFVTGFSQYAIDAIAIYPSGYILKQVTPQKIRCELDNLRYPLTQNIFSGMNVQCFGNFEVFIDNKLLSFKSEKAKELFAILIDKRGSSITTAAIASILWEEQEYTRYIKNRVQQTIMQLKSTLKSINYENILIRSHNKTALDIDNLYCDYYEFLKGNPQVINKFMGEYMAQYSWAEFTAAYLYWKDK